MLFMKIWERTSHQKAINYIVTYLKAAGRQLFFGFCEALYEQVKSPCDELYKQFADKPAKGY
jgi:hypothetical protein